MSFSAPKSIAVELSDEVVGSETSDARLREIVDILERKLKISPSDADIRGILGVALFRVGEINNGLSKMKSALKLDPSKAKANNMLLGYRRAEMWSESLSVHLDYDNVMTESVVFSAILAETYSTKVLNVCKTEADKNIIILARRADLPLTSIARDLCSVTHDATVFSVDAYEVDGLDFFDMNVYTSMRAKESSRVSKEIFSMLARKYDWSDLERVTPVVSPGLDGIAAI